jgi:flagellar hook-basal body complex protein FliE
MSYEDHWMNNPNAPSSHTASPAPAMLTQSTSAVDVSKYESEITMLRCDLIDKQAVMREVITAYDKAKADLADMTAQRDYWEDIYRSIT